jgi:hypothetical protein
MALGLPNTGIETKIQLQWDEFIGDSSDKKRKLLKIITSTGSKITGSTGTVCRC